MCIIVSIIVSNEPKYCACLYVNNVLYVYNCIHQKAIKPSCILYLGSLVSCSKNIKVNCGHTFEMKKWAWPPVNHV